MAIQNEIDLFFKWVKDRRVEIDSFRESYRYILLMVLLDTLSNCAFPSLKGKKGEYRNKERFLKLINKYSNWEYKDYVSLMQLQDLLNQGQPCAELRKIISNKIASWPRSRILRPEESDLKIHYFQKYRHKDCWARIKKSKYDTLLWQMRNSLIHELRTRGRAMAISPDDSTPYYHGTITVTNSNAKVHSWELNIPPKVISDIVLNCANNLKRDFEEKAYNPYDSFKFGSSWYEL